ncbi:precorrin-6A reductase [Butyrivibrio sp. YAB3001]|uniref:precorrin-6A reductase n=1 Tax=Butyrivibrio sp. YAB3001 TaxID=1520812 RepID=UPI0008F62ACC|nr:precorrin-6A reductase [Butyrivibrio sp. YAB3001]SFC55063.1 precorrin-6Y C5,15-methyltransferase (decarboxylating) [Butyrivibrio sp. YAB3001]
MKCKILVFGGTTEGRVLADYLRRYDISHEVSVATDYGKEILEESGEENLMVGRKNSAEISDVIISEGFTLVVDATHPFATAVSEEIRKACDMVAVPYLRLKRDTGESLLDNSNIIYVDTIRNAVSELERVSGNVLLLTGSKNLEEIAASFSDVSRLYVRVLPNEESIRTCVRAGLQGRQIIAMQGPFSKEMNIATIKEVGAEAIFTKESGKTGGLDEKINAALECGIKVVVLKNPESMGKETCGYDLKDVLKMISAHADKEIVPKKSISLAGIGPGSDEYHTQELEKELKEADIIFGAKAVLKNIQKDNRPFVSEYDAEIIFDHLRDNPGFEHPLILFSGDISLCSGAKKATAFFEKNGYEVKRISGISSVTVLAERLRLSLENIRLVSAHGKECNVIGYVNENSEVIVLTSSAGHASELCTEIKNAFHDKKGVGSALEAAQSENDKDNFLIVVGCELGTEDERILDVTDTEVISDNIKGKCLIYVKNPYAKKRSVVRGLCDDEIIRGHAPMTKEEIRALSLRKLALSNDSVLYDVGAGTGSISLEAALLSADIKVFSIEKNDEAYELLRQNKDKFGVQNMELIYGEAPEALQSLPVPSHAFIGGSSGNIKEILRTVFDKNDATRVVINTVTAESFAEVVDCIKEFKDIEPDIIQVSVSRYKKVGRYHLADALNPVYIVTLQKGAPDGRN